jgi:hypothetical protein
MELLVRKSCSWANCVAALSDRVHRTFTKDGEDKLCGRHDGFLPSSSVPTVSVSAQPGGLKRIRD